MQEVTFTTGQIESVPADQTKAYVISYADNQNHAVYLNVSMEEAKRRFTERMNERHPFEVEREGWDATINLTGITDELWIMGTAGRDFQDFSQQLMQQVLDGQNAYAEGQLVKVVPDDQTEPVTGPIVQGECRVGGRATIKVYDDQGQAHFPIGTVVKVL